MKWGEGNCREITGKNKLNETVIDGLFYWSHFCSFLKKDRIALPHDCCSLLGRETRKGSDEKSLLINEQQLSQGVLSVGDGGTHKLARDEMCTYITLTPYSFLLVEEEEVVSPLLGSSSIIHTQIETLLLLPLEVRERLLSCAYVCVGGLDGRLSCVFFFLSLSPFLSLPSFSCILVGRIEFL